MKILTIKLKQHTPLIHFQPTQYGATLRASEVKPKLDRFLFAKLGDGKVEAGKKKAKDRGWTIGKEDRLALDYKMAIIPYEQKNAALRVVGPNAKGNYTTGSFSLLLGNMGGKKEVRQLSNLVLHNYIVMRLTIHNDELWRSLQEELPKFFALINFGQRSSKGFGSFTVYRMDEEPVLKWNPLKYYKEGCPYMFFKVKEGMDDSARQKTIFDVLDFYWKGMKSGINYTKGNVTLKWYIKSFLYYYLNHRNLPLTWEKRKIKEHFHLGKNRGTVKPNPNRVIFARALLGCPDKFGYGEGRNVEVKHHIKKADNEEQRIARIPSPVYFKPVCIGDIVYVYILFNQEVVTELGRIEEKTFRLTYNHRNLDLDMELFLNEDNYMQFIDDYHEYMSSDKDVLNALYCNVPIDKYTDSNSDSLDEVYGFVPRDSNWEDILKDRQAVGFSNV